MTPLEAIVLIESAKDGALLFRNHDYRELLKLVHPDRFAPTDRKRADDAAKKLGQLKTNGQPPPITVAKWTVAGPLAKGDVADLYSVTADGKDGVLKIARSPDDQDLMTAEANALRSLACSADHLSNFRKYVPVLLDSFTASGRGANVITQAVGCFTLEDIRTQLGKVPFRHMVWMTNRLLSALGFVHRAGCVHGGITPDHLLYHPRTHGMTLVGWCSSVPLDGAARVPIISEAWKNLYPQEILSKAARESRPAHPSSDIFMATTCVIFASDSVPKRFNALLEWCTAASPAARPLDAWELQEKWVALAKEEYGDPKYIELVLPKH